MMFNTISEAKLDLFFFPFLNSLLISNSSISILVLELFVSLYRAISLNIISFFFDAFPKKVHPLLVAISNSQW